MSSPEYIGKPPIEQGLIDDVALLGLHHAFELNKLYDSLGAECKMVVGYTEDVRQFIGRGGHVEASPYITMPKFMTDLRETHEL